ncbi:MAG: hypothetical protein A3F17_00180 [Gammaproteobacteria bacterium RIFCSPHIGHO2_12_FULL_41_15]|nr:MAG: hypothetical protein A3F17_00180 [Gammaproteobacteria bacterium RIFCSPHIGHO2_12_FULL_41_15]
MQKSIKHNNNQSFIGRLKERKDLLTLAENNEASIVMIYGRRRVGKTELIEQTFRDRHLLKFEGIEDASPEVQRSLVMRKLAEYTDEPLLKNIKTDCWLDVFDYIHRYTSTGIFTIYFEEVQWLASYEDNFVNELKHAWDNQFRHNPKLLLILCGSSPSFMIKQVIRSKSLYNRSQHELHLQPFSLQETQEFLSKKSKREVMNAYLSVGGMPEYLKRLKNASSIYMGICQLSFKSKGYFVNECDKIFISSLSGDGQYKKVVEFLSDKRFATREQIAVHLRMKTGGRLSDILSELELCHFIQKYTPYNTTPNSTMARYRIADHYLQFYFRFIKPRLAEIAAGQFEEHPNNALTLDEYQQYLAYSFERYCQSNSHQIAKILGFSGIRYKAGSYYSRTTNAQDKGFQIDLLFDRDDHVITLCEIKYSRNKVNRTIIDEVERKLALFPNKKKKTIQRVLISIDGVENALISDPYFDRIITIEDLIV